MNSPWEPAIPQAFQRHGGRNRNALRPVAVAVPVVESPAVMPNHDDIVDKRPSSAVQQD